MAKKNHFVDNEKLYEEFKKYRAREDVQAFLKRKSDHAAAKARGEIKEKFRELPPPLPDYIATSIWLIANNFARKPNWRHLSYLDEMISDAVVYCCRYGYNFDPEVSDKPFSYLTAGVKNSFFQRIAKEKLQASVVEEGIMRASLGQISSYAGDHVMDATTHVKLLAKHVDDLKTLDRDTRQPGERAKRGRPRKKPAPGNPVDAVLGV